MPRLRLATILILANVGLFLLAVLGVAWLANQFLAQLPVDPALAPAAFLRGLLLLGLAAVSLAALANYLIGQRLTRAMQRLTIDLPRIGYGDLAPPIVAPASLPSGAVETLVA